MYFLPFSTACGGRSRRLPLWVTVTLTR